MPIDVLFNVSPPETGLCRACKHSIAQQNCLQRFVEQREVSQALITTRDLSITSPQLLFARPLRRESVFFNIFLVLPNIADTLVDTAV